jgi:hypothetical protein
MTTLYITTTPYITIENPVSGSSGVLIKKDDEIEALWGASYTPTITNEYSFEPIIDIDTQKKNAELNYRKIK